MDWSLFWTAAAAIATFLAVGVALWIGIREGHRSLQARYDDARPVLQIISDSQSIPTAQGDSSSLDWNRLPNLKVQNIGKGPAFNVRSVIYGSAAIAVQNASSTSWSRHSNEKENHWYHWSADVVSQTDQKELQYAFANPFGLNKFSEANKYIASKDRKLKYTFNAPEQPLSPPTLKEPWSICRVTITYHDIFHRKHASIYDLIFRQGWQVIAIIYDIINDLGDLVE